jgi:tRNA-2-methylthio-N6-dimethylallyladenosine synthase
VDLVVGPNDLVKIYDYVRKIQKERQRLVAVDSQTRDKSFYKNLYHSDKKHCYVNISEGCSNFCSYCVVPYVRGLHRSRPVEDILREIKHLINDGISSVTLLGQNVNDYQGLRGKGQGLRQMDFVDLLGMVSDIKGINELSFVTSHPKDIDIRLFNLMAEKENIKKHLHLPIQSGSNKILKLMNRKYTREHYIKIIKEYRERVSGGFIGTDIIVGYPTETERDFNDTLDLMKQIQFDFAYIFKYSPRPHTKAAQMPDDVSMEEKKIRHGILLKLQKEISKSKA